MRFWGGAEDKVDGKLRFTTRCRLVLRENQQILGYAHGFNKIGLHIRDNRGDNNIRRYADLL